jgi:hypothetical protein
MEIAKTGERVNKYKPGEGKPAHQDAPAKAIQNESTSETSPKYQRGTAAYKKQNITVAAGFGRGSVVEFENIFTKEKTRFELDPGSVYAFGEAINLSFTHKVVEDSKNTNDRISIILWGTIKNAKNDSGWTFPTNKELDTMKATAV